MQGETLKVSTAKQDFLSLSNLILSTSWQPGSSAIYKIADSGGLTDIQPPDCNLTITICDNSTIQGTIFNNSIGKITYELPNLGSLATGFYLQGDSQTVTNQTGSSIGQICVAQGDNGPELQLHYRPEVTCSTGGLENGKLINNIRIYIINLNCSDTISVRGELPLKISCVDTQLLTQTFETPCQSENIAINSQLDGAAGTVWIPLSSTSSGSIVNVETVISDVTIERSSA